MTIVEAWKLWYPYTKFGIFIREVRKGSNWGWAWNAAVHPGANEFAVAELNRLHEAEKATERDIKKLLERSRILQKQAYDDIARSKQYYNNLAKKATST